MNPFKKDSIQYKDFETMSDCKWHCTKCELISAQAKTWQQWRDEKGIQLDKDEKGNWYKWIACKICGKKTVHRKLRSTEIDVVGIKARKNIPDSIKRRAKEIYKNIDEYTLREEAANTLELDHRKPQVRWTSTEKVNTGLSDEQITEKFMLLTRKNNLLKSRFCEKCKATGIRANGYRDIEFWYVGNKYYDDVLGCEGCFWYNPSKWRKELNKAIKEKVK